MQAIGIVSNSDPRARKYWVNICMLGYHYVIIKPIVIQYLGAVLKANGASPKHLNFLLPLPIFFSAHVYPTAFYCYRLYPTL